MVRCFAPNAGNVELFLGAGRGPRRDDRDREAILRCWVVRGSCH